MFIATLICCVLLVALFLYQHIQVANAERPRAKDIAAVKPVTGTAQMRRATLHLDNELARRDWTKPEAYDPVLLHEFGWQDLRIARDDSATE